jgi:hypothetical protein
MTIAQNRLVEIYFETFGDPRDPVHGSVRPLKPSSSRPCAPRNHNDSTVRVVRDLRP